MNRKDIIENASAFGNVTEKTIIVNATGTAHVKKFPINREEKSAPCWWNTTELILLITACETPQTTPAAGLTDNKYDPKHPPVLAKTAFLVVNEKSLI